MHTVSSPHLLEDAKNIDPVLKTEGWETLMTFTRESARKYFPSLKAPVSLIYSYFPSVAANNFRA
jgi:nuclear protein localization family protein 4